MRDFWMRALATALVLGPCIALVQGLKAVFLPMGIPALVIACAVTVFVIWLIALRIDSRQPPS